MRNAVELLEALLKSTSDLFAILDPEFRFLAVSEMLARECEQIFGKKPETGDSLKNFLAHHSNELERSLTIWKRALSGETFSMRIEVGDKGSDSRTYELAFAPLYDKTKKLIGATQIARNVTNEQDNNELKIAAERVQLALAAGAIVGTWDWDLRNDHFTVDERFAENFGIDPSLGRSGLSLEQVIATVHPEDLAGLREAIAEAIARSGPYSHEYRVRGLDGVYRWIEANGRVDHAPDGTPLRFPGVLLDVEQRRELENERDRATQLLRAFIDAVPGVVFAKDREGRMLVANRGVAELIGLDPEQFIGKTDLEVLERKDQAEIIMATDRRIMESGQTEVLEEEVNFPDGRRAVWLSTKAPFRDTKGKVTGLIGSSIDITARKDAEAALEQRTHELSDTQNILERALETRDEFLSVASHELKTPLTTIRLHTQSLQRQITKGKTEVYEPDRMDKFIEQIDKQALRLNRLVDDMLDISRIRSGRLNIERESFNFSDMVKEVVERMKPQFLATHGSEPVVRAGNCKNGNWDRARLEQILINLLTNAIRYGKGNPIEIRCGQRDSKNVFLSVIDQGVGIDKEDQERIFNRFERAIDSNEVSGLGLGLSICRELVYAHRGRIWVESELGKGSAFHVELPIE